jgi:hypothetical protein
MENVQEELKIILEDIRATKDDGVGASRRILTFLNSVSDEETKGISTYISKLFIEDKLGWGISLFIACQIKNYKLVEIIKEKIPYKNLRMDEKGTFLSILVETKDKSFLRYFVEYINEYDPMKYWQTISVIASLCHLDKEEFIFQSMNYFDKLFRDERKTQEYIPYLDIFPQAMIKEDVNLFSILKSKLLTKSQEVMQKYVQTFSFVCHRKSVTNLLSQKQIEMIETMLKK